MLAWLFTRLPFGSVAWRVQILSDLARTATVALACLIGRRIAEKRESGAAILGAVFSALLLAFAPLAWGHSLLAEVYTLLLFFIALILWLMLRWRDDEGPLWLAALALGVGMGNHITLAFIVPFILLLLWEGQNRLAWRDVLFSAVTLGGGLLVYLYAPWRASAGPIINWGDPDTREGFSWMVTGQRYRRLLFALPSERFLPRLEEW